MRRRWGRAAPEFVIPDAVPKFAGAVVRDLHQDDLVFLARAYRRHPVLGRAFDTELRRRAKAARRAVPARAVRPRVFA